MVACSRVLIIAPGIPDRNKFSGFLLEESQTRSPIPSLALDALGICRPGHALLAFAAIWAGNGEVDSVGFYSRFGPLDSFAGGVDVAVFNNFRLLAAYFACDLDSLIHWVKASIQEKIQR